MQFKNWQVCRNFIDTCGNKAIEFAQCNGGLIADNFITSAVDGPQVIFGSRNVQIRELRKAGTYELTASDWIWSGNSHTHGSLTIAAGAEGNVVHDIVSSRSVCGTRSSWPRNHSIPWMKST